MELTPEDRDTLDDYRHMMGDDAGALALALDRLTDAMAQLGQHKVHCRVEKGPHAGQAPLDLVELLQTLQTAKSLVQATMLRLRGSLR
jgi:hypothetical protein